MFLKFEKNKRSQIREYLENSRRKMKLFERYCCELFRCELFKIN